MAEPSGESSLPTAPSLELLDVAELVRDLRTGQIRIPEFQRGWRWKGQQVLDLLDSIYRGYPIGSLIFWRSPRPAERLKLGPREILAPELSDARVVIDGQQRLTSLLGTLDHPDPRPDPEDPFVVFFDARSDRFSQAPSAGEKLPDSWVPVSRLLDVAGLQDWLLGSPLFRNDKELHRKVLVAAGRLREARIPTYLVDAVNEMIPREVFRRINRGGRPMEEADVFDSLVSTHGNPKQIEDLESEVAGLRMGKNELRRHKLLQCVMAVAGLDVTRRLADQRRTDDLQGALEATAPALRSVLVFLESEARIRHLRLLPYPFPLIVLCRFFHFFPEPNARSRLLLVRWIWRGMLTAAHDHSERTALRASVQAIQEGEEEPSVQRLLRLVSSKKPESPWWLSQRFDSRSAASRICGLWFASLQPRDLDTASKIDIKGLLDQEGAEAFRPWPKGSYRAPADLSAAARILHPVGFKSQRLVELAEGRNNDALAVLCLASHGFHGETVDALGTERWQQALLGRKESLRLGLDQLAARLAGWGRSDRPSIEFLLKQGADEDSAA